MQPDTRVFLHCVVFTDLDMELHRARRDCVYPRQALGDWVN